MRVMTKRPTTIIVSEHSMVGDNGKKNVVLFLEVMIAATVYGILVGFASLCGNGDGNRVTANSNGVLIAANGA